MAMAFRATTLAKSISARLSRQTYASSPLLFRTFSFSSTLFSNSSDTSPPPLEDHVIAAGLEKLDNANDKATLTQTQSWKERQKKAQELQKDYGFALPPFEEWPLHFPPTYESKARTTVVNPELCKMLAETFVPEGSKDKIVLEAFPGPGTLSRALLDLPKERIKRLIIMEDEPNCLRFLTPLEAKDPRVTVIPLSGYHWDTYDRINERGLLDDVEVVDWTSEHPQLQYISHIPAKVHGEQLVSQFFRSIPEQQWLFKYGRFPLKLVMTETLWQRISAPIGNNVRCKLTVIAEAAARCNRILPPQTFQPFKEHFYPSRSTYAKAYVGVNIMPRKNQIIQRGLLDEWDYCLRRMFVQKAKPLSTGLPQLAPGAKSLLKKITDETLSPSQRLDSTTPPREMTAKQWRTLVEAFSDWPFKPEELSIDSYHDVRSRQQQKRIVG